MIVVSVRPEVIKLFSCSAQLNMKFFLLINRLRRNLDRGIYLERGLYFDGSIKMSGNSIMIAPKLQ